MSEELEISYMYDDDDANNDDGDDDYHHHYHQIRTETRVVSGMLRLLNEQWQAATHPKFFAVYVT